MALEPIRSDYDEQVVAEAIAGSIRDYYEALIAKVDEIQIDDVLRSKNPYLYRVKDMQSAHEIVESIVFAFISSSEETIFGNKFFEPLAIAVSGGRKSTSEGVDIEVDDGVVRTAIAVKSGTSVFNADSWKRQRDNFNKASILANQGGLVLRKVVGYGYGKKYSSRTDVIELAGEDFWTFLSGDSDLYKKIIGYMGDAPSRYADEFNDSVTKAVNRITASFSERFVLDDGSIDWDAIVDYNSGSQARKSAEEMTRTRKAVVRMMRENPMVTKKALAEGTECGMSRLNKVIDSLVEDGTVSVGHAGRARGWTVSAD